MPAMLPPNPVAANEAGDLLESKGFLENQGVFSTSGRSADLACGAKEPRDRGADFEPAFSGEVGIEGTVSV